MASGTYRTSKTRHISSEHCGRYCRHPENVVTAAPAVTAPPMAAPAALCAAVTAEGSGRHKAWNFRSVRSREADLWSGGRFGRRPLARIEILALDFHIEAIEGDAVRIRQESRQWIRSEERRVGKECRS